MVRKFLFRYEEADSRVNVICFTAECINYNFAMWKKHWKMFLENPFHLSEKCKNLADNFLL